MAGLTSEERNELRSHLEDGYFMFPRNYWETEPKELRYQKYRLVSVLLYLGQYGLGGEMRKEQLPDVENLYDKWRRIYRGDDDYIEDWEELMMTCLGELNCISELFLNEVLKETAWEIYVITEFEEYGILPGDVVERCADSISVHWQALNERDYKTYTSAFLSGHGCRAESYLEIYAYGNVFLVNRRIAEALKTGEDNPGYRACPEYQEIIQGLSRQPFDNWFMDVSCTGLGDNREWLCKNFLLGECMDSQESVDFYQMNYEAVADLLLADMAAAQFIERFQKGAFPEERGTKKTVLEKGGKI